MTKVQNWYSPMSVKLSVGISQMAECHRYAVRAAYGATVSTKPSVAVWPEPSSAYNMYSVLRDGDT